MPGSAFKKQAAEWRQATRAMLEMPFQIVKDKMVFSFSHGAVPEIAKENTLLAQGISHALFHYRSVRAIFPRRTYR